MNEQQTQFNWRFGLQWLVVCGIGAAIGATLAFFSIWSAADPVSKAAGDTVGGLVAGALFGLLFALGANVGPGFLLGGKGISAARWIAYSGIAGAAGAGIVFAVALSLTDDLEGAAAGVAMGLALGLPIGIAQWLILKQRGISANEWPLISVVAYFLAAMVLSSGTDDSNMVLTMSAVSLILGGVTGLGMMWLLRRQTAIAS